METKKFFVYLFAVSAFLMHGVSAGRDKCVEKGQNVTLDPCVIKNSNVWMRWYFNKTLIAKITGDQSKTCTDVQCNNKTETFRDRLKLDNQTGSLTIMNIRNTDSGEYTLKFGRCGIFISMSFNVSVTDSCPPSAARIHVCDFRDCKFWRWCFKNCK